LDLLGLKTYFNGGILLKKKFSSEWKNIVEIEKKTRISLVTTDDLTNVSTIEDASFFHFDDEK